MGSKYGEIVPGPDAQRYNDIVQVAKLLRGVVILTLASEKLSNFWQMYYTMH